MRKLYKITADYRPHNPNKPHYYAYGTTKNDAKKRFNNTMSHLKVYEVEEVDELTAKSIEAEPAKHIILYQTLYR